MVRSTIFALAALGLAAAGPAAAAPRAKPGKAPSSIEISNQRQANLTEFELLAAGPDGKAVASKIVARLSKPLAGGKKAKLALKGAKGCEFVARWKFEDAGDEADVNLCNDPRIVLTD